MKKGAAKKRSYRRKAQAGGARGYRTFTETIDAGTLLGNSGGIFAATINSVSQVAQYQQLYSEFTVKKLEVLLLPEWQGQDENSAAYNNIAGAPSYGVPRITFAVQESANNTPPINELEVLAMNGAKIRLLNKVQRLYSKNPVPCLPSPTISGLQGLTHNTGTQWMSFDSLGLLATPFMGLKYWISQTATAGSLPVHAYYKITFAVRDPR